MRDTHEFQENWATTNSNDSTITKELQFSTNNMHLQIGNCLTLYIICEVPMVKTYQIVEIDIYLFTNS